MKIPDLIPIISCGGEPDEIIAPGDEVSHADAAADDIDEVISTLADIPEVLREAASLLNSGPDYLLNVMKAQDLAYSKVSEAIRELRSINRDHLDWRNREE